MSAALVSTRDGIGGYWDLGAAVDPGALGTTDGDILYLRMPIRSRQLDYALCSTLRADRLGTGSATVGAVTATRRGKLVLRNLFQVERPDNAFLIEQLRHLRSYADLRAERVAEVHAQINDILSFFAAIALLDQQRRIRSLELLAASTRLCIFVEMQVKHLCRAKRPIDFAPEVQPMVQTPDHSTFPSGHATEAFAAATVLHRLMTGEGPRAGVAARAQPFRLAHRIAVNRTVAGVHFPVDSAAGALMGCLIGEHVFALATGAAPSGDVDFAAAGFGAADDFTLDWLEAAFATTGGADLPMATGKKGWRNDVIGTFYHLARKEFEG
jgi:hypothetical protein